MYKVLLIAKNILKRIFRKPSNYLLHILLPLVVSIAIFMIFNVTESQKITMVMIDNDDSVLSQSLIDTIEDMDKFYMMDAQESEINDHIIEGRASFGYIIDKDFEKDILSGTNPAVRIIALGENEGTGWIKSISDLQIQNLMDTAYAANYDKNMLLSMLENLQSGTITFGTSGVQDITSEKSATIETLGMYIMVLLISTFLTSFLILDEKKDGTFARIGRAPVPSQAYTLGNVLANFVIIFIQITLVIFTLTVILNVTLHANIFVIYMILLVFALCGISLGIMMSAFAKSMDAAGAIMSLILSPSCMIAGCFWPLDFMPKYMQTLAYFTPQRWTLDALSMAQTSGRFIDVMPSVLVVLAFSLLFFLIATYKFKTSPSQ